MMWRVRYRDAVGKVRRKFFRSQRTAQAEKARLLSNRLDTKQQWSQLTPAEQERLLFAFNEARSLGVDLVTAVTTSKFLSGNEPLNEEIERTDGEWLKLSVLEKQQIICVLNEARARGVDILQAVFGSSQARKMSKSKALSSALRRKRVKLPNTVWGQLFQEAGHHCAFCSEKEISCLQVHHIDENSSNNEFINLIIACASCHRKITTGIISAVEVRLKKEQLAPLQVS